MGEMLLRKKTTSGAVELAQPDDCGLHPSLMACVDFDFSGEGVMFHSSVSSSPSWGTPPAPHPQKASPSLSGKSLGLRPRNSAVRKT